MPNKVKYFVWLAVQERILTNKLRVARRLTEQGNCERCGCLEEDTLHVLRDCPKSKEVWNNFNRNQFVFNNVKSWITGNILTNCSEEFPWNVMFTSIIWHIWKCRNDEVFNGKFFNSESIVVQSKKYASDVHRAIKSSSTPQNFGSTEVKLVK